MVISKNFHKNIYHNPHPQSENNIATCFHHLQTVASHNKSFMLNVDQIVLYHLQWCIQVIFPYHLDALPVAALNNNQNYTS